MSARGRLTNKPGRTRGSRSRCARLTLPGAGEVLVPVCACTGTVCVRGVRVHVVCAGGWECQCAQACLCTCACAHILGRGTKGEPGALSGSPPLAGSGPRPQASCLVPSGLRLRVPRASLGRCPLDRGRTRRYRHHLQTVAGPTDGAGMKSIYHTGRSRWGVTTPLLVGQPDDPIHFVGLRVSGSPIQLGRPGARQVAAHGCPGVWGALWPSPGHRGAPGGPARPPTKAPHLGGSRRPRPPRLADPRPTPPTGQTRTWGWIFKRSYFVSPQCLFLSTIRHRCSSVPGTCRGGCGEGSAQSDRVRQGSGEGSGRLRRPRGRGRAPERLARPLPEGDVRAGVRDTPLFTEEAPPRSRRGNKIGPAPIIQVYMRDKITFVQK